jgi:FixJ family two-component response regulator
VSARDFCTFAGGGGMNNGQSTVFVVDDDAAVLKAVSRLLRASGYQAAAFSSAQTFLAEHDPAAPGCVVLDLAMPGVDGLELQRKLAEAGDARPIIFLTGHADVPASVKAMKQGAADFLVKPVERDQLMQAVGAAMVKDQTARRAREEIAEIRRRLATLTPREYEVFEHVISGKLNKQTAAQIGAAEKTVKIHRARVMEKMKVRSVAELVRMAEHVGVAPNGTKVP